MLKVGGIYKDKHSDNICFIIISISNESSYLICEGFYIQNTKDFSNKSIINRLKQMNQDNFKNKDFYFNCIYFEKKCIDGYLGQIDDELLEKLQDFYKNLYIENIIFNDW